MLKLTQLLGFSKKPPAPGGGGEDDIIWNTGDMSGTWTLSDSDHTATGPNDSNLRGIRGVTSRNSGKRYFEIEVVSIPNQGDWFAGFSTTNSNLSTGFNDTGIYGYRGTGALWTNASNPGSMSGLAAGEKIMVAIDFAAGKLWLGREGTWYNSGDPAAGTNETGTFTASTAMMPTMRTDNNAGSPAGKLITLTADFEFTVPTGFSSWATP